MKAIRALVAVFAFASFAHAADEPPPGIPDSGAGRTWRIEKNGMAFRLTRILPDQVRAFYGARGFDAGTVETLVRACFFQTVIRNDTTDKTADVNLAEWRIENRVAGRPLTLERDWQRRWEAMKLAASLRKTFRYALFPSVQRFAPGDWNMGMTSILPAPAERFNLRVRWQVNNESFEAVMEAVECN